MGRVVMRRDLKLLCVRSGLWLWLLFSSVPMKILPDEELGGDEESCLLVCWEYGHVGVAWRSEKVMPQNNDLFILSHGSCAGNDRMEMLLRGDLPNNDENSAKKEENVGALPCGGHSETGALLDA